MKKYFKNGRFVWVSPAIIFCLGIFNLFDTEVDRPIRILWWVLTSGAFLLLIFGVILHFRSVKKNAENIPSET